ncbi:MAG: hypothetical protein JNK23_16235 [Opitutaceae bacterium]|nr:hypothetical protein [Opitutaceae bacterium]
MKTLPPLAALACPLLLAPALVAAESFATTVDSGVAEIVRKQEDRRSYIRSGS